MSDCVCRPGNPCLWHTWAVEEGTMRPSETPCPENFQKVRRRAWRFREKLALLVAPWLVPSPVHYRTKSRQRGSGA